MKKLLGLLALSMPLALTAQTEQAPAPAVRKVQHQVGFDATSFIKQFLSFNSSTAGLPENPFSLTYKALASKGAGNFRMGVRMGAGLQNVTADESINPTVTREIKQDQLAARLGMEVQQPITGNWTVYYGLDGVYTRFKSDVKTTFNGGGGGGGSFTTTITEQTTSAGGGPVLGIQFNINRRICLSTETTFYYLQGKTKEKVALDFPGSEPEEKTTKSKQVGFILPSFINFNIIF